MSGARDPDDRLKEAKGELKYNGFFAALLAAVAIALLLAGVPVGGWLLVGVLWFGVKALLAWKRLADASGSDGSGKKPS